MKITTFDPLIVSKDLEGAVKVFEELGFAKTHAPVTTVELGDVQCIRMKHEAGYHIDIADALQDIPRDYINIRMNVDNFAEAYDLLIRHGFKNNRGDNTVDTKSAKAATMVSPSGFSISLVEHIKEK